MTNGEIIRSKDNGRLVHIRSIRDGKVPDLIFIEGKRQCVEAVRAGINIDLCLVSEKFDDAESLELLASRSELTLTVAERIFDSIADTKSPQGIIAIVGRPVGGPEKLINRLGSTEIPTIVYLAEINNPANLGAILRTAEAAGAVGVITSIGSTDAFSPKANRAALGANLRLPIWEGANRNELLEFAEENSLVLAAAIVSDATAFTSYDWTRSTVLMLGSEAHGLNDNILMNSTERITIPLSNDVESLNLAVSAGILLFESVRQNKIK